MSIEAQIACAIIPLLILFAGITVEHVRAVQAWNRREGP